jgi:hypothetical protein
MRCPYPVHGGIDIRIGSGELFLKRTFVDQFLALASGAKL